MGDRASVSFKNGENESVALFHHWGGESFGKEAIAFARDFKDKHPLAGNGSDPFTRLEPSVIMLQFIRSLNDASYSVYLGRDQNDGDNSDNGHTTVDLAAI